MTKAKIAALGMLLLTPAAFAEDVSIGWSGYIVDYASTPGSGAPLVLDSDAVQGRVSFNTSLFPSPDPGTAAGILSYSGADLFHSTLQWDGGTIRSGFGRGTDTENILFNTTTDELTLSDQDTYTDSKGNQHAAQFILDLTGYGSAAAGSGNFLNVTQSAGYAADFTVDSVHVKTMAAPEIDTASTFTAMSLLAGCLAVIRGRRRAGVRAG